MAALRICLISDNLPDSEVSAREAIHLAALVDAAVTAVGYNEQVLQNVQAMGAGLDVEVETRLVQPDFDGSTVLTSLKELQPSLVVCGRGGIYQEILGRMTEAVIRAELCPVLVYSRFSRRTFESGGGKDGQMTVLTTTDGSTSSATAIQQGFTWAARLKGQLSVLTVAEDGRAPVDEGIVKLIETITAQGVKLGLKVSREMREGEVVEEIVGYSIEQDTDLLVLGTRGSGKSPWILGNIAREIFLTSLQPVMFTPPPHN